MTAGDVQIDADESNVIRIDLDEFLIQPGDIGIITIPGRLSQAQFQFIREHWKRLLESSEPHRLLVLDDGARFQVLRKATE